jgi:hypothetical protein
MIARVEITNFRKFTRFSLRLRGGNILVGPNNSGKSSLLDGFRVLEACLRHVRTRNPALVNIANEGVFYGYEVPENVLPFSLANATYNYSDDDAILAFQNTKGIRAIVRLHPGRATRFYIDSDGARLATSSKFRGAADTDLVIVPTLTPLEADEQYVMDDTARRNAGTRLASRVLRNIWLRKSQAEFDSFKADVEAAWPSIHLQKPEVESGIPPIVRMFFSEGRIDREVQWAGFGFQVWMQILTHLGRGGQTSTVVIDEPDIYLHPDLQRRLLRLVRERFGQFLLATHSVEIINDAEPYEVVPIDPGQRSGRRIKTEEEFASLYRHLGSTDNADLARIARSRKVIFVEGRDGRLLRRLAARLQLPNLSDPQSVPIVQLGGFSEWRRAAHAVWAFRQVLDMDIAVFCLFDRDYRSDSEVSSFLTLASEQGLVCRVLERKEIENYLLEPVAIQRAISRRLRARHQDTPEVLLSAVQEWLEGATASLKVLVMSQRAARCLQFSRESGSALDPSTIIEQAAAELEGRWAILTERLRLVPGKEVLSRLNEILQRQVTISLTDAMIVEHLSRDVVDESFLQALQELESFCTA